MESWHLFLCMFEVKGIRSHPKMAKKASRTSGFKYSSRLVEVTRANLG